MRLFCLVALLFVCPHWAAAAVKSPPPSEYPPDTTVESHLQSLSTVPGIVLRKDPFMGVNPPFEAGQPSNGVSQADENAPVMSAPILERYQVAEYEVVAVLVGDKYPRALLRLPLEGRARKVVIVKEADRLGNRQGVIKKISAEGLKVQQVKRGAKKGSEINVEVLLKVGGLAAEQKAAFASVSSANPGATQ